MTLFKKGCDSDLWWSCCVCVCLWLWVLSSHIYACIYWPIFSRLSPRPFLRPSCICTSSSLFLLVSPRDTCYLAENSILFCYYCCCKFYNSTTFQPNILTKWWKYETKWTYTQKVFVLFVFVWYFKQETTFNGGSLGSCIDEERSKLRYVVWNANWVNHRIFERKWRFRVFPRACLFECHFHTPVYACDSV